MGGEGSVAQSTKDFWVEQTTTKAKNSGKNNVNPLANCTVNTQWISDGFCDDGSNIAECLFDGGDCCMDYIDAQFCEICVCYETGEKHPFTMDTTTSSTPGLSYRYFSVLYSGRPKLKFRLQFQPKLPVSAKFRFRPKPKKGSAETETWPIPVVSAETVAET